MQGTDPLRSALLWTVVAAGLLSAVRLVLLVAAVRRGGRDAVESWGPPVYEPVSVIVPARGEEAVLEATLQSLLRTSYPMEIIAVDDGSADSAADVIERYSLFGVRPIRETDGGRSAALNAGILRARGSLIVLVDGETVVDSETINHLVQPFSERAIGAVCGSVRVADRTGLPGRWQHLEYTTGFNLDRKLCAVVGSMIAVPGAIGAFRREALADVGGVSGDTLAGAADLTMALLRAGWQVVCEEKAVAWIELPAGLGRLWRQRCLWSFGIVQAMWKHRGSVLMSGGPGRLGRRGLPYLFFFQVVQPMLVPVAYAVALYGLLFGPAGGMTAVWLGFLAVQLGAARYAFTLDHEDPRQRADRGTSPWPPRDQGPDSCSSPGRTSPVS